MRISRTALSCLLRLKTYGTYPAGATYALQKGKIAYFLTAQWTSTILAGGTYGLLYYSQPSVPSASQGVSFSAAQNLNATYGLFLRANHASGSAAPIETSVALGGVMNNPLGRNLLDQAWDRSRLEDKPVGCRLPVARFGNGGRSKGPYR